MQEIYIDNLIEILKNKRRIEKEIAVKLTNRGKHIFFEGKAEHEFLALEVMKAVNVGFSVDTALLLKDEHNILHELNVKDLTKRHDLETVRGRIIGKNGRTLKTLKNLTDCNFTVKDNKIGIIGDTEDIEDEIQSVKSIVQGSKQGKVYGRLERRKKEKRAESKSLGLNIAPEKIEKDDDAEDDEDEVE